MSFKRLVNRDLNPLLRSLPPKFERVKDYQIRPIMDVVEAFDEGVKVVALDAPTGSGKTLMAEIVRRELETRATYVCHNKELQSQFQRDFDYSRVLYGRANYKPIRTSLTELSCADCNWTQDRGKCDWCPARESCPYQVAKVDAIRSSVPVLNSSYWLNEVLGTRSRFAKVGLCILDEADTLENVLMGQVEVYVSERAQKEYEIAPPTKMTKESAYLEWGERVCDHLLPEVQRLSGRDSLDIQSTRALSRLSNLVSSVQGMVESLRADEPWVYTGGAGSERRRGNEISFKPVKVARSGPERIWKHDKRFLLMSASFVSPQMCVESDLGYEGEYRVVSMESTFPAKNRQIVVRPVADMTKKGSTDAGFRILEDQVGRVLEDQPGRVLIHSVSYDLTRRLLQLCSRQRPQRCFTYSVANQRAAAISDFRGTGGSVLVAPSADRGVDLPGDDCRAQIIVKVPFLSLGDKQVTERLYNTKDGRVWYNVQVARTIMQMVGRAVRSQDDWAITYVLDSTFVRWYREWGHLLPKWFRKGIRFENGVS